jgi:Asp-tRNA(Asn)/Glu-tRNA(Gln) amidotransferase A subunit family amidase
VTEQTRREAIATLLAAAAAPSLTSAAQQPEPTAGDWRVTARTITELENFYALPLTPLGRQRLIDTASGNLANVRALRGVTRERSLKPALHFDPRLPGKTYGPQANRVRYVAPVREQAPADSAAIAFASVREQAHWLRSRQLTSGRLVEIYLERVARIDPQLLSFITVTADLARSQAAQADRELAAGKDRGPLHGIPYGIKDLLDTAGIRTTWGAAAFRDRVPQEDAAIVKLLREAGSPLLGKLSTGALGHGHVWFGGKTRNPWNIAETSGGSSAGPGAATAAGLVAYSIGTDGLGSILNPANRCGIVGLRPSYGRVSRRGSMPMTPSFSRAGPMTRTVEDAALVLAALNGHEPELRGFEAIGFDYDGSLDLTRVRVGFVPAALQAATPLQRRVFDELRGLGVQLVPIELPQLPFGALTLLMQVEAAAAFEDLTLSNADEQMDFGDLNPGLPNIWRRARLYSAVDFVQADRVRRLAMQAFDELFTQVDAICGPTYGPGSALTATSLTGHPGITLRIGFVQSPTRDPGDAPVDAGAASRRITQNITLHGRMFEEGRMLAVAQALETKLAVWSEAPAL